jgi:hypothetical protein
MVHPFRRLRVLAAFLAIRERPALVTPAFAMRAFFSFDPMIDRYAA